MRVVSIDIETTGLDPLKHRVLEVGAVIFSTKGGVYIKSNWLLEYPDQETLPVSPFCAKLHTQSGLWDRFLTRDKCIIPAKDFSSHFSQWLRINNLVGPYTAAGKNFGSFDLQFLKQLPEFDSYVKLRHRCFDPSILYMKPDDEVIPSLDVCCERAGIVKQTDHTALGDALLVAELTIRGLQLQKNADFIGLNSEGLSKLKNFYLKELPKCPYVDDALDTLIKMGV